MDRYNSVNNTKNDFRIAFWKLYQRYPIEKISVSELCRVAGYNRTTFYVYYDNIYDILHWCIEEMLLPLEEHVSELEHLDAPEEKGILERLYMAILKTNEKRIRLLIERHQLYILEDKVKEVLEPVLRTMYTGNTLSEKEIDYLLEYQLAASFGVIARWFHSQDLTDQEITHLLIECSMAGPVNIINSGITVEEPEVKTTRNNEILSRIISELETQEKE